MSTDFLHGIETIEIDGGLRPIQTVKSSVIGLIGTAPDADAATFPLNTPVLLPGGPTKAALLDDAGTLKDAVDAIHDQVGATVVVVRVEEGSDESKTFENILGDVTMQTGVHAFRAAEAVVKVTPRILIAPGFTSTQPTGVNAIAVDAAGSGYSAETTTVTITGDGAGAKAVPVIVGGKVIRRHDRPATLFYLDPPYHGSAGDYGAELFSRDDFARLESLLGGLSGAFLMSINDTPEIREIFADFVIEEVKTTYSVGVKAGEKDGAAELIISNVGRRKRRRKAAAGQKA